MTKDTIKIKGMSCQHCVMAVKKALTSISGISEANVAVGSAEITFDESKVRKADIEGAIVKAGYEIA